MNSEMDLLIKKIEPFEDLFEKDRLGVFELAWANRSVAASSEGRQKSWNGFDQNFFQTYRIWSNKG